MKRFRDTEYFVTEDGKVFRNNKQLKPAIIRGYKRVRIYFNCKIMNFYIHRLVAELYIPNMNNKPDVNHKDGDKLNNTIKNLEWNTKKENMEHAYRNGLVIAPNGESHHLSKLKTEDVLYIRKNYIPRDREFGMKELSRKFNVSIVSISYILKNKTWKHIK